MRFLTIACLVASCAAGALAQERLLGVDTSGSRLMEIDPTNGSTTFVAALNGGGTIGALAYDAVTDTLYASSSSLDSLYTIDYGTGQVTLIGPFNRTGVDPVMHGLEFYPPGNTLLGLDWRDKALVDVSTATGQATMIGVTPLTGFGSLAWDAGARNLYGGDSTTDSLWEINPATGGGTLIGPFNVPAGSLGTAMAWSSTHGLLAINNAADDGLYSIDTATGAATLIGLTGTSNLISLVVVPEPAGLAGLALLAAIAFRRRRALT